MLVIAAPGPAQVRDAARLYHDAWHETQAHFQDSRIAAFRDEAFFLRRVEDALGSSLVAWLDGQCSGYAGWRDCEFDYLFVAMDVRDQGIGQSLLAASEIAMRDAGVRTVSLHCLVGNDRARRFYERNGWMFREACQLPVAWAEGIIEVPAWRLVKTLMS
jgi:ribosomal protein S18 acetylase RimI-like enzyme